VLLFVALIYAGFSFAVTRFENAKLIPGLIMMGSLAVPLATVILFFEWNTPRNIPFHRVMMLVALGGIVSLWISLFGFEVAGLSWLGASQAGIVEEIGKLLTVVLILPQARYRYILNGMLAGAAVGAGFAIFESAGYAFEELWRYGTVDAMTASIHGRALFSPFGHMPFTAIAAGALWRVKGDERIKPKHFLHLTFFKTFLIPVGLHMLWNSPLPNPLYIKSALVGIAAWFVVLGLVQQGLRQVKEEQVRAMTAQISAAQFPEVSSPIVAATEVAG
jgi:RsiW-degrading membrane proteinase PrsW (M82 family)